MRRLSALGLVLLPLIPAAASAQAIPFLPPVSLKLGYMQSDLPGLAAGADFKIPMMPIRVDADVWSAFDDFSRRSAGTALTVNYVKSIPFVYFGAGVGYAYGLYNRDHFNDVAGKVFVGGNLPLIGGGVEGSVIFTDHVIGMLSLVWKI